MVYYAVVEMSGDRTHRNSYWAILKHTDGIAEVHMTLLTKEAAEKLRDELNALERL
tara:strand:+ start:20551 stop:20718 length:168 start_codon:yes stop_codon:yes gene_type:complete